MAKKNMCEFDRIIEIYDHIICNGEISISVAIDYNNKAKERNSEPKKNIVSQQKMANRDFKMLEKMFSINKENYLVNKSALLMFNSNGYRYFMLNNSSIRRKDLYLRYQYVKTKEDKKEEKADILDLILTNMQNAIIDIDAFKLVEKDKKIETVNKAISENNKLLIVTIDKKQHLVSPLKFYESNGYWYFAAIYDNESLFWRRIDNIISIECTDNKIEISSKTLNENRNLKWDAFGNEKSEKRCTIILELKDENIYKFFKLKKYKTQQKEFIENGKFYVEFKFNYDWEIKPLLFQWMEVITIVDIECKNNNEDDIVKSIYDDLKYFLERAEHKNFFNKYYK